MRYLLLAALVLGLPAAAHAHVRRPAIPDAVAALQHGPIYVDYDAKPGLTELEADALGRRLLRAGTQDIVESGSLANQLVAIVDELIPYYAKDEKRSAWPWIGFAPADW